MRKDYKRILEEIQEKVDALGTERYYTSKEWADEMCEWLSSMENKEDAKYIYIKDDNTYFAVKSFHNGIIKCGGRKVYDRYEPIGVAGGIWFECIRFNKDADALIDVKSGDYIVYPASEFVEITKSEFDNAYEEVIGKICELTPENIRYQYDNYYSYFEDKRDKYAEYLDREDIKLMLKEIDKLWEEEDGE